jgi:ATPase subunit of ABC transporter with duplicated ATPase domains
MTVVEWLHRFDPDASAAGEFTASWADAVQRRRGAQADRRPFRAARRRGLLFCRIMLQKPNVLVLDEPTNHLDLESINALNVALQRFEGTVLLVTHDQDLLEEVGTRVWQFETGRIRDFKGSYEEFAAALA